MENCQCLQERDLQLKQIKAIIFDLDGVICSTDQYHYLAWKKLADRLGIYFDERVNQKLRGVSRMESLEIILGERSGEFSEMEKRALAEEKNHIYREYLSSMTPDDLSEETRMTLETLRSRGYLLGIGSSSKNTKQILSQLGLGDFFDAIADGTQITYSKPDPEVFLLAAEKLGVEPEEALVIEDADSGIQAAYAGAFRAIGIRTPENQPDSEISIKRLANLLDIL